ncbi:hypothetical protein GCM10008171_00900 [Methylopila jiangsuensis]|uniref:MxaH protein n=2 Tax=Methylopila jiangsuensis TaxID=586230 RepID=A0A9W6JEJ9_9HYPH|nr:hypothetical protein GCM10008171_00900 [Methylopila jiangsuensis]
MSQHSLIKFSSATVFVVAMFCLTGCDDPAPSEPHQDVVAALTHEKGAHQLRWLEIKDKIAPGAWLASREAGREIEPSDPNAVAIRDLIAQADQRYTEGPRMIANRAVQVQEMLSENGVTEQPRSIIAGLVSIAPVGERAGFGETCQHYVTARIQGMSRDEALAALGRQPLPMAKPGDEQ